MRRSTPVRAVVLLAVGCAGDPPTLDPVVGSTGASSSNTTVSASSSSSSSSSTADSSSSGGAESSTGCIGPDCACIPVAHTACDEADNDLFAAMGIGCPDEPELTTVTTGSSAALGTRTVFGETGTWGPIEGTRYTVLGTGFVAELDTEPEPGNPVVPCSKDLGPRHDPAVLPDPIDISPVLGDCSTNPALVGMGDCSGTLEAAIDPNVSINDYTELRVSGMAPPGVTSFSFTQAFFTTEYPDYLGTDYTDAYFVWLESEAWTGNVALDEDGGAIGLSSTNLGIIDAKSLMDTCMLGHAGTPWLRTTAPITGGADFTLVFAIFDATDSILDSYAFVDAFEWGCDEVTAPSSVAL